MLVAPSGDKAGSACPACASLSSLEFYNPALVLSSDPTSSPSWVIFYSQLPCSSWNSRDGFPTNNRWAHTGPHPAMVLCAKLCRPRFRCAVLPPQGFYKAEVQVSGESRGPDPPWESAACLSLALSLVFTRGRLHASTSKHGAIGVCWGSVQLGPRYYEEQKHESR